MAGVAGVRVVRLLSQANRRQVRDSPAVSKQRPADIACPTGLPSRKGSPRNPRAGVLRGQEDASVESLKAVSTMRSRIPERTLAAKGHLPGAPSTPARPR